ncbi:MAG TPA: TMEM165/GDT1 family protein [Mycobacterium sp.]|jgi:Ca2+/H+ antiporter, TMEM165/GDT1 family|nr:TMEM165/GDT1 family protein [Mycobacterium sp.]HZU49313.1 TMEM165/GDT1 family protein [Mycobacterium sp.]
MLAASILSFWVVFVAELGDRSQLITITYSLRYRWWLVLTGVAIASIVVHGVSVAIGHSLGMTLPARPMALASAVAFLIFAVWTWREAKTGDDGVAQVRRPRFALLAVVSSIVLAELSDKTTLATITLASDHNWVGVWIGTTVAMVAANGLAIVAGILLHRRMPVRLLHVLAGLLFLAFGLWMLFDGALGWRWVAVAAIAAVMAVAALLATLRVARRREPLPNSGDRGRPSADTARPGVSSSTTAAPTEAREAGAIPLDGAPPTKRRQPTANWLLNRSS